MEPDFVGLVELALQIYVGMSLGQLILRGDQISIEVIKTKCRLELIVRSVRSGFGVNLKSLITKSVTCVREHLLSARTSRKSSKSRSSSAFRRASQASSADMSATRDVSKTRFALHSDV